MKNTNTKATKEVTRLLESIKTKRAKRLGRELTKMVCVECGHKFFRIIGANIFEIKCPRCGGYDTEIA